MQWPANKNGSVERFIRMDPEPHCWLWLGSLDTAGYGQFRINRKLYLVHRLLYEATHGPIPAGLELDHLCRIRSCVNPAHLEP